MADSTKSARLGGHVERADKRKTKAAVGGCAGTDNPDACSCCGPALREAKELLALLSGRGLA